MLALPHSRFDDCSGCNEQTRLATEQLEDAPPKGFVVLEDEALALATKGFPIPENTPPKGFVVLEDEARALAKIGCEDASSSSVILMIEMKSDKHEDTIVVNDFESLKSLEATVFNATRGLL